MSVTPTTPNFMFVIYSYDDVFGEIGLLSGEHHFNLDPSVPAVVNPPRRIPFLLKDKVKMNLIGC